MATVTVHQAKTRMSELLRRVEAGEEIIIARGNKPVAVLKSFVREDIAAQRQAGQGAWAEDVDVVLGSAFDPMTDAEIAESFGDEFLDLVSAPSKAAK